VQRALGHLCWLAACVAIAGCLVNPVPTPSTKDQQTTGTPGADAFARAGSDTTTGADGQQAGAAETSGQDADAPSDVAMPDAATPHDAAAPLDATPTQDAGS